jgi:hypothetical protein
VVQTKEPQDKDDFGEWLACIICFACSIQTLERNQEIALHWPPQWAVKAMNRATADNQSAQSEEEGLEPPLRRIFRRLSNGGHARGTTDPGTALGNFVPDHQPPSALNPIGQSQPLYPTMYLM